MTFVLVPFLYLSCSFLYSYARKKNRLEYIEGFWRCVENCYEMFRQRNSLIAIAIAVAKLRYRETQKVKERDQRWCWVRTHQQILYKKYIPLSNPGEGHGIAVVAVATVVGSLLVAVAVEQTELLRARGARGILVPENIIIY